MTGATTGPSVADRTRSVGSSARLAMIVELAPVALVVLAEAAWISVLGGLLQEFALRPAVLGIPALAGFVVAGIAAARLLGRRLGGRWPFVALGLIGIGVVGGWLASSAARDTLGEGIGPAIAAHPGGLLAGMAVLRGFAHARMPLQEGTLTHLLGFGVPGLAVLAILGGVIAEPYRALFLADALAASIVFIVSTTVALALVRLSKIGLDSGFDWRRNPAWLGLVLGCLAIAVVAALPLSAIAGTAIQAMLGVAIGPLLIIGLTTGFDRAARRVILFFLAVGIVIYVLVAIFGAGSKLPDPAAAGTGGQSQPSVAEQVMTLSLGGLLLLAAIIGIVILAAVWMRRTQAPTEDLVAESRTIDRGAGGGGPGRRRRRFIRRSEPDGAAAAYVALVEDLERHPAVRRDPAETPAEHAARLRSDGRSGLSLDLLAADYALARYGGVSLPEREDRRAVTRWRVLRRRIPKDRGGSPES